MLLRLLGLLVGSWWANIAQMSCPRILADGCDSSPDESAVYTEAT